MLLQSVFLTFQLVVGGAQPGPDILLGSAQVGRDVVSALEPGFRPEPLPCRTFPLRYLCPAGVCPTCLGFMPEAHVIVEIRPDALK